MGPMPSCRTVTELLTERDERALSPLKRAQLKVHLAMCSRCRAYEQQFQTTVAVLRGLPKDEPLNRPDVDALLEALGRSSED